MNFNLFIVRMRTNVVDPTLHVWIIFTSGRINSTWIISLLAESISNPGKHKTIYRLHTVFLQLFFTDYAFDEGLLPPT